MKLICRFYDQLIFMSYLRMKVRSRDNEPVEVTNGDY